MPKVTALYNRSRARVVTASEAVELFAASTVTEGKPHPPHAHAHLAGDGFESQLSGRYHELEKERRWLLQKVNTRYRHPPPEMKKWKQRLNVVRAAIQDELDALTFRKTEGTHIDPATRGEYPLRNRIVDPHGPRYIDRNRHSQFEDSEQAVMALTYVLNSAAAERGLYQLSPGWIWSSQYNRIVIHSKTAALGLAQAPKNPSGATSAHPRRNRAMSMVERGSGAAGLAPLPSMPIARVTTILDRTNDEVVLVTHFPTATAPRPNGVPAALTGNPASTDFLELKRFGAASSWHQFPATTPSKLSWDGSLLDTLKTIFWRLEPI